MERLREVRTHSRRISFTQRRARGGRCSPIATFSRPVSFTSGKSPLGSEKDLHSNETRGRWRHLFRRRASSPVSEPPTRGRWRTCLAVRVAGQSASHRHGVAGDCLCGRLRSWPVSEPPTRGRWRHLFLWSPALARQSASHRHGVGVAPVSAGAFSKRPAEGWILTDKEHAASSRRTPG